MKNHILFSDDFRAFPIGEFPYDPDHTATGEYHYVVEKGDHGAWVDQVVNYSWNGHGPTWLMTEKDGRHFMECQRIEKNHPHRIFPTLQTGKTVWNNYAVSAAVRRLSLRGMAGLCFCMNHSIDTLVFSLENGDTARLAHRYKEEIRILAEVPFVCDSDTEYRFCVDVQNGHVRCAIDGSTIIEADVPQASRGGKIALTADCPTRFGDVQVCVTPEEAEAIHQREEAAAQCERSEMAKRPAMKLWKKIDLKNFGTSRQLRFGHLWGDESWQIVLAQMQKRVTGDAYGFISCLTAIDLDGNVLWQLGEPSKQSEVLGKVSADMPLQVYDIDHDGFDEIIVGWDFEIRILDGRTGAVKRAAKTPLADEPDLHSVPYDTYAFERLNPDGIRICNFRGLDKSSDILIKDRYCRVWALDDQLNLLWYSKSPTNTGHCPLPVDVDGDGRDEVLVGYRLLDGDGKELWHYPITEDHTDEIVAGKFMPDDQNGYFACVAGTQGFFIGDFYGNIVARDMIGHAQRVSVANYCPEREGFEIAVTNFWGHQGCIFLYDAHGNQIWEMENEMNGNIIAPVNWDGSGAELILTNADAHKGGLLNGDGVRAVAFPDDGHPDRCVEVMDLTGDERDELVVWDYHSLWIYTQDDGVKQQSYKPVKFPAYNASNYRGEYAFPDQSYLTFEADRTRMIP
ncbi:MAG: hypothetical protein IKU70_02995 [Clostridia bacterium]|nr:hypothetical protein [Clostridia bacterium]